MTNLTEEQQRAVRAYQQIRDFPNTWNQARWRDENTPVAPNKCGAKLCFAGHVVFQNGAVSVTNDPGSGFYS